MKPPECKGCPLYNAEGPVWGEGPEDAQIMFIGEGPGREEARCRPKPRPFVGPAGTIFDMTLRQAGLVRGQCYVTNVVKCWPRDGRATRTPTPKEVQFCSERWLAAELARIKPNVLVPLGQTALDAVMDDGESRPIGKWRGFLLEKEFATS